MAISRKNIPSGFCGTFFLSVHLHWKASTCCASIALEMLEISPNFWVGVNWTECWCHAQDCERYQWWFVVPSVHLIRGPHIRVFMTFRWLLEPGMLNSNASSPMWVMKWTYCWQLDNRVSRTSALRSSSRSQTMNLMWCALNAQWRVGISFWELQFRVFHCLKKKWKGRSLSWELYRMFINQCLTALIWTMYLKIIQLSMHNSKNFQIWDMHCPHSTVSGILRIRWWLC